MRFYMCLLGLTTLLGRSSAEAAPITINFDSLAEFSSVGNQIAGLTFSNALVLTAESSLNDLDFPPASGPNVIVDEGPMSIAFANQIYSFSGFFTYVAPVTLTFFDASNTLLGAVTSQFLENYASSGNNPNELLQFTSPAGIASVLLTFVLDDLTFDTAKPGPTPVPEPGTFMLLVTGGLAVGLRRLRERCVDSYE
jgi:PEP-CTERM motif